MFKFLRYLLGILGIPGASPSHGNQSTDSVQHGHVRLNSLEVGPIRHVELPSELVERAEAVRISLQDVVKTPSGEWLEGFQRDKNPEREIAIWEAISEAMKAFQVAHPELSDEQLNESFGLLLLRSGESTEQVLEHVELKSLARSQAENLLSNYRLGPNPVTIIAK